MFTRIAACRIIGYNHQLPLKYVTRTRGAYFITLALITRPSARDNYSFPNLVYRDAARYRNGPTLFDFNVSLRACEWNKCCCINYLELMAPSANSGTCVSSSTEIIGETLSLRYSREKRNSDRKVDEINLPPTERKLDIV